MISRSFSLLFRLKKPSNYSKGPQPIYLRITIDGHRAEISTQREWDPARWNQNTGRAVGSREDVKILNNFLESYQRNVYDVQRKLMDKGTEISAEKIKNELCGNKEKIPTVVEIFQQHNNKIELLVGSEYAPLTLKRYKTALSHLKMFIKWKFEAEDLEISKLDYGFISDYEFYLKSVRKCGHNSTVKYLSNFKKIVLESVKRGALSKDPFFGFSLATKEVKREFLTQEEIDKILAKHFLTERVSVVRDIFLFCCYTGLAYIDVFKLRRSEIFTGIDGEKWLSISRQKTGTPARIPLLPICVRILEKYETHPFCICNDKLLPVWSNQKMNEYLKEIADLCAITKKLTCHIARHTFATTITLSNDVPIDTVSKMLGHKSIKITQHYAKTLDNKVSSDMERLRNKLTSQKKLS